MGFGVEGQAPVAWAAVVAAGAGGVMVMVVLVDLRVGGGEGGEEGEEDGREERMHCCEECGRKERSKDGRYALTC